MWKIQKSSEDGKTKKQMKVPENSSEEESDEMEASNLSGREFRVINIKVLSSMKKERHRNHNKGPDRDKEYMK